MNAKEFFESKNGGKTAIELAEEGVTISPVFAVIMMEEYAQQKCKKQRELCFTEIYNAKPKDKVHTTGGIYYQSMTQMEFRDTILNSPLATDK